MAVLRARRWGRLAGAAIAAGALGGPLGWAVTDRLEQDDRFCIACHLEPDVPLHIDNFEDFRDRPAVSLAVAHAAAGNDAHDDGAFRCIDCHGGTGLTGRARVKLLSAKDAFWYAVGRFEEPDGMRWPLRDADCTWCHASFEERADAANPAFHALPVHNVELGVGCVECHLSHERGGLADHDFLHPERVREQCARCHAELAG